MQKKKIPLPAKLFKPRLTAKFLIRKRLFSELDKGVRKKAVWVSGPPGAGKTTLVNSFIEEKKIKTLWYQVDCADSDPATFFHYLGVWAQASYRKGAPVPRYSPEIASNLTVFSSRYFQEFFAGIRSPFLLVLDNFQEASGDPMFIEAVCAGLKEAPEGCAFVLISRTEPPAAFARFCVNDEMRIVCWDDMRLTEKETLEVAGLLGCRALGGKSLKDLHLKAEGWMAGLLLLLEQAKAGAQTIKEISGGATGSAFNYFMAEVFDKIDPAAQGFLMKAALFQDMTPEMAAEISGEKEASKLLSSLNAGNFFVAKRSYPRVSYQYHPLFRDFLIAKSKEVFEPDYLKALAGRAALIAEKAGQLDDAAGLFIEGCDWPGLHEFIRSNADSFVSQGRLKVLEEMLKAIPHDFMKESPWLLYYSGVCQLPSSPANAREGFAAAYELFEAEGDPEGLFLAWTGVVDTILYDWKDFKALDYWIDEFDRHIKKYGGFPSKEVEMRAASCIFSALMFRQPEHPDLQRWEERVKRLVLASKSDTQRISITRNLILYYLWTGNVAKAGGLVDSLQSCAKNAVSDPLARLMWLRSAALYNVFIPRTDVSLASADDGLRLAEETGVHVMDLLFCGVGIYCCMITNDIIRAEVYLDKIRKELRSDKCADIIYYHHQSSVVEWRKGNISEALEQARITCNLVVESGMKINAGIYQATLIYLLIEADRLADAEGLISDLRSFGRAVKSHLHEVLGLLAEAFLAFKKGSENSFLKSFDKALRILSENRMNGAAAMFRASNLAALCAKGLEEGLEPGLVCNVIELNNLKEYYPAPWIEAWPWEIKIYTLGRFEIFKQGKKVEFSRKAQQKPLALLKELVSLGGRQASEETICDALWPDSEGDLAYRSLTVNLHRLRKLLGNDKAIRYMDGMVSLDESCFWVDAWAFSRLLENTETTAKESLKSLERAARVYSGEYLPGEVLPTAISLRERIRGKFIRCVEKLGRLHEDGGRIDKAIECYEKGLEADELAEGFYGSLMRCHRAAGKRAEALKTYGRLKAVLSKTFGIEPSSEIEALYLSITNKKIDL